MNVSLTPELEELVKVKVQSGMYHSASEVIREGLRMLQEKDMLKQIRLEHLRKDLMLAAEQAERGEVAPLDAEAIIAEGRRRMAARKDK